jgi:fatty acid desaturase
MAVSQNWDAPALKPWVSGFPMLNEHHQEIERFWSPTCCESQFFVSLATFAALLSLLTLLRWNVETAPDLPFIALLQMLLHAAGGICAMSMHLRGHSVIHDRR